MLYEIILQIERLVVKHFQRLKAPGCDAVVQLTMSVVRLIPEVIDAKLSLRPEIVSHINNLITVFEKLSTNDRYYLENIISKTGDFIQ